MANEGFRTVETVSQNEVIKQIIENNRIINEKIKQIIELRRSLRIPFEQNGNVDTLIQSIFEKETKKCLELYKIEFPSYQCQGKEGFSFKKGKETADCYGGIEGLQVTFGMQKFIDEKIMPIMQKMGYSINEEGIAYFNLAGNDYNTHISNIKTPQQYVGSTRDQMDYFAELFAKNGIDIDWVLDALPHEAMHTFGTIGGNTFLKEGITEELTREIGEKYGIHLSPTAHTQEAEFVRKLEMIVGRDNVIYSGMWSGKFKEKAFKEILERNPELKYEELSEIFELLKYEPSKLDDVEELKNKLSNFSENYPDVTEILKNKVKEYRKQDEKDRYEGIAKEFDEKLGLEEGTFYKYAEVLDSLYSLNGNHKTNHDFYRLVYGLNIEELKGKVQSIYEKDLKKVEKTDIETIEKLKKTLEADMKIIKKIESLYKQISQDNNLTINSFQDLMSPINEYVKGRDLNFDEQPKDYSEVLKIQREEIAMFEAMKVAMFHDQKSEGAFRVIETGVHTITSQDIKRVAKKDEVVAEKENAMEVRAREEKDREDELKQANLPNLE